MIRLKSVLDALAIVIALLGFAPLFPYLHPIPRLALPLAAIAGVLFERKRILISGLTPTIVSVLLFVFYALQASRDNLVSPAVNLIVVFLAVRLVGEKSPRNYLQIYALSLFALAGVSLFSLSPLFLGFFLLMVLLIAVSLVLLTYDSTTSIADISFSRLRTLLAVAVMMPVASLPLLLLFFLILPRTQYPLWNFLNIGGGRVSGFSEKVVPGSSTTTGENRSVAFRVKTVAIPPERLYWRVIVLNAFDGIAWVRKNPPGNERINFPRGGDPVRQELYPEPGRFTFLPALNIPRSVSGVRNTGSTDGVFSRRGPPAAHEKYEAVSVPGDTIAGTEGGDAGFYLETPRNVSPRMRQLADTLAGKGGDDAGRLALLTQYYREGRFAYTTKDLPTGDDPLDLFLFEKKKGSCEYFASSFALLSRLAGVPSRLVGGYRGGTYNGLGEYYVITDNLAHVWVEVFLSGRGWVTVDPTGYAYNYSGADDKGERGVLGTLAMALDSCSYYWNLAVINYDLDRQLQIISSAHFELRRLRAPDRLMAMALYGLLAILPLLIFPAVRRRIAISSEMKVLKLFFRQVRRVHGVEIGLDTGLFEFAAALKDPDAERFVALYSGAVYRDRPLTREEIHQLEKCVRQMTSAARRSGSSRADT
jgi:protein-glutamine gamma-glutamyltransferase